MAQPRPPLSTSQIGIDADGVMWLATPSGLEPAGGGGPPPGPGPLLSSTQVNVTLTTTIAILDTLALPAGTFDVWAGVSVFAMASVNAIDIGVSVNGTTVVPGSGASATFTGGTGNINASTTTREITLAAPQSIYAIGNYASGTAPAITSVQLFARQLS